ncbi:MAG: bifunctional 2-polyprenyl-6-hydroxyphenol methylase/3-demethylubiquinol 3-O-methyltransferase UbiG [Thiohalospira sp.]
MNSETATLNSDPVEVARFDELASRWWDRDGECAPLHAINPLRLEYIDGRAPLEGRTAIDVGCGGGLLSEAMALRGATVTGIDMGAQAIRVAKLHRHESGAEVEYDQTTAEAMAEKAPESFDVVTCMEMLEHVPDPASVIAACARLVKPGGRVFFSTLNRNPKSYLLAIVGAEYLLGMLPRGTHDYSRFITPAELDRWARAADLVAEDFSGISYNPLSRQYRVGDDLDVNYMACYRRG